MDVPMENRLIQLPEINELDSISNRSIPNHLVSEVEELEQILSTERQDGDGDGDGDVNVKADLKVEITEEKPKRKQTKKVKQKTEPTQFKAYNGSALVQGKSVQEVKDAMKAKKTPVQTVP